MDDPQLSIPQMETESMSGVTIAVIVLIVVVVIAVVILIVYLATNNGSSSPRPPSPICPLPPQPVNVNAVRFNNYITVSWNVVFGADSYNIYNKIGNSGVCTSNYNGKNNTSSTSITFNNLPMDQTIYFTITAINNCGEGPQSNTFKLDPIMPLIIQPTVLPDKANSPKVQLVSDNSNHPKKSNTVNISYDSDGSKFYIFQGTGQHGAVDNYLYIVPDSEIANQIALKCQTETSHILSTLKSAVKTIILDPKAPKVLDSTFEVKWKATPNTDQYVVFLASQDKYGNFHHVGDFTQDTSLVLNTNPGDNLIFGLVLGYKTQDQSDVSDATIFVTK